MAARFINSQLEITDHGPINLDTVSTFEKFEHASTREEEGRYQIMFLRDSPSNGAKEVFWKYNCKCDRDKDYDSIIQINSTTL